MSVALTFGPEITRQLTGLGAIEPPRRDIPPS